MARSCELWVAAFFVGWLFPALVVESADLPKEAAALIEAHEAEVEKLRQTFAGQLNEWRHDLIKELKLVQKQLAEKELLDEAILVRNLVRTLEAEANSESTTPVPVEQFQKLPKEAQKLLLARESPGAVKNRLEKDGSAKLAALLKSLMELQTALTKNDKLDEAVAVRDWIRRNTPVGQLPPPRKKVPAEIPEITQGSSDLAQVQRNHQQAVGQLLLRHSQEVAESREWLVEQLKAAQASHTKGGRLDEALEIRKTVDAMTAENVTNQLVPMVTKLRAKLPSDAVRAVDHFLQTVANSQSEMSESQKVLDKQLMKPTEAAAQKALLGPDLNAARQAVAAVYTLKREFPAFLHSGRRQPLTLSPQTSEILAELTEGNVKRRAKLEELEAPLRKTLLEKLGKLQESNLKAEEELAIRRTIETLSLSNFSGLRGYLLFFIDSELQGESAEVVKKYWQEMEAHIDSARTELAAAHKVLKPRLEAALKTQVEANDWGAALATAEQIQSPPRFFEPFAVKTNSGGGGGSSHFPWNGSVIDVRDGAYLVINMHQHEEWMTRDRLRLGSETVPELKPRRPGDFYAVPPSFAVTTKTLLKPGRIVLFQEHTRWNLGEIKEVRSNDVVVKSLGFGFSRDSEVQKSGLRTLVPMEP